MGRTKTSELTQEEIKIERFLRSRPGFAKGKMFSADSTTPNLEWNVAATGGGGGNGPDELVYLENGDGSVNV